MKKAEKIKQCIVFDVKNRVDVYLTTLLQPHMLIGTEIQDEFKKAVVVCLEAVPQHFPVATE
jgi:hypothetical protein